MKTGENVIRIWSECIESEKSIPSHGNGDSPYNNTYTRELQFFQLFTIEIENLCVCMSLVAGTFIAQHL